MTTRNVGTRQDNSGMDETKKERVRQLNRASAARYRERLKADGVSRPRKGRTIGPRRPLPRMDPLDRFTPKTELAENGCILWTASLVGNGYGKFFLEKIAGRAKFVYAHRFAYEQFVGPIPEGLELDHLCSVRACVNVEHLEAVTRQENLRRAAANARLRRAREAADGA